MGAFFACFSLVVFFFSLHEISFCNFGFGVEASHHMGFSFFFQKKTPILSFVIVGFCSIFGSALTLFHGLAFWNIWCMTNIHDPHNALHFKGGGRT
ncbi:hypothetical protein PSV09DRAFT_2338803 [Bipolaris maydis]|uniref:uncharacterized protein n=1 Tax=Cochliobolus heterostrophus TaxID=5016 RepID=UPI0024D3650A|nr:hypothetical protein J3E73DRAFT_290780 [Bipolaris maydis]KAJ5063376.1 hypothetical protein J3E74DRAFT_317785 [Bipolaris maydis]KAJ6205759.1 hypothetical protein PSV09DRAFT_2338803 [Bipolaris maydis]KAJ6272767.1 hypothetical protein PSV08DRAFT_282037 [Bipolaris maydis]